MVLVPHLFIYFTFVWVDKVALVKKIPLDTIKRAKYLFYFKMLMFSIYG